MLLHRLLLDDNLPDHIHNLIRAGDHLPSLAIAINVGMNSLMLIDLAPPSVNNVVSVKSMDILLSVVLQRTEQIRDRVVQTQ